MDSETKRKIILEHMCNPYNKAKKSGEYTRIKASIDNCIDEVELYIKIENDVLKEVYYDVEACAITSSTCSIMAKNLQDLNIDEAIYIVENYKKMIEHVEYDSKCLKEANAYEEIYKQPSRKKCALLPWDALYKELIKIKDT